MIGGWIGIFPIPLTPLTIGAPLWLADVVVTFLLFPKEVRQKRSFQVLSSISALYKVYETLEKVSLGDCVTLHSTHAVWTRNCIPVVVQKGGHDGTDSVGICIPGPGSNS